MQQAISRFLAVSPEVVGSVAVIGTQGDGGSQFNISGAALLR